MATPRNAIAAQRQQLVKVDGIDGYFATKTGGEVSASTTTVWDGGQVQPEHMAGSPETSNIVVTKPYRPAVHHAIVRSLAKQTGRLRTTLSVYDTDPELAAILEPITYADALLVRVKRPDLDAKSSAEAMFELEFAVSGEA